MSIPPNTANAQIVTSRPSNTASVMSRSWPPKTATALVRRLTRQRPFRSPPPKIASMVSKLSAGFAGSSIGTGLFDATGTGTAADCRRGLTGDDEVAGDRLELAQGLRLQRLLEPVGMLVL